jgi:hypothetical protein
MAQSLGQAHRTYICLPAEQDLSTKSAPAVENFSGRGAVVFFVLGSFWGQSDRKVTTFSPDKEKVR